MPPTSHVINKRQCGLASRCGACEVELDTILCPARGPSSRREGRGKGQAEVAMVTEHGWSPCEPRPHPPGWDQRGPLSHSLGPVDGKACKSALRWSLQCDSQALLAGRMGTDSFFFKTHSAELRPGVSDSVGLGWGLGILHF